MKGGHLDERIIRAEEAQGTDEEEVGSLKVAKSICPLHEEKQEWEAFATVIVVSMIHYTICQ